MLKHKSFVLNSHKKPKAKKVGKALKEAAGTTAPKKETGLTVVAHYDKNEPISLSIPKSLSFAYEMACDFEEDNTHGYHQASRAYSASYEPVEDFSEANAYFRANANEDEGNTDIEDSRNRFYRATSTESSEVDDIHNPEEYEDKLTTAGAPKSSGKNEAERQNGINTKATLPEEVEQNREKLLEEDKKFEEDLKAIMEGKKEFDRERVKKDPSEVLKEKNHGVMDKKEDDGKKLEDKLKNDHAIFDKIAQSMEMANSYDLGSIAMDKKFDDLEQETDANFTKKIHAILEESNEEKDSEQTIKEKKLEGHIEDVQEKLIDGSDNTDLNEGSEDTKETPPYVNKDEDDNKILTKDFLKDLDKLNELEQASKPGEGLSSQASFSSTISIKHQLLKSRIFAVSGGRCEVMINSHWNPPGCSTIPELYVNLYEHKTLLPDPDYGVKKFRIGASDTHVWANLPQGDYYLIFYFNNRTNPYCELKGTVDVRT